MGVCAGIGCALSHSESCQCVCGGVHWLRLCIVSQEAVCLSECVWACVLV